MYRLLVFFSFGINVPGLDIIFHIFIIFFCKVLLKLCCPLAKNLVYMLVRKYVSMIFHVLHLLKKKMCVDIYNVSRIIQHIVHKCEFFCILAKFDRTVLKFYFPYPHVNLEYSQRIHLRNYNTTRLHSHICRHYILMKIVMDNTSLAPILTTGFETEFCEI